VDSETATLSFKLYQDLSNSSSLRVQALSNRTLTKGGEYDYHTFGYNQLHSGGTLTASLCAGICFLWRTTLYDDAHIFEHGKQCNSTTISADDNQGNSSAQSQLVYAFISACGYNDTHVLDYTNPVELLWESTVCQGAPLLKRFFSFLMGNTTSSGVPPTALYVAMMNVKRKADIEHSLAMIEVMNRIKYVVCHGPLARITEMQDNISLITVEHVRLTTDIRCHQPPRADRADGTFCTCLQ
jgi:hypothetical protein